MSKRREKKQQKPSSKQEGTEPRDPTLKQEIDIKLFGSEGFLLLVGAGESTPEPTLLQHKCDV